MASSRTRRGRAAGTLSVYRDALPAAVLNEADKLGTALHVLAHKGDLTECHERTEKAVHAVEPEAMKSKSFADRVDVFFRAYFLRGAYVSRFMRAEGRLRAQWMDASLQQASKAYAGTLVERASATLVRNREMAGAHVASLVALPMMGLPMWIMTMMIVSPSSLMLVSARRPVFERGLSAVVKHLERGQVRDAFFGLLQAEEELGREMASASFYDEQLGVKALALREVEKAFLKAAAEKSWLAKKVGYVGGRSKAAK